MAPRYVSPPPPPGAVGGFTVALKESAALGVAFSTKSPGVPTSQRFFQLQYSCVSTNLSVVWEVRGIKPKGLHIQGTYPISELCHQPLVGWLFFETRFYHIAQAGLEHKTSLPGPPGYSGYRPEPPSLAIPLCLKLILNLS